MTVFELRHNNLKTLPSEIGDLIKLVKLDLSKNKLNLLPTEMYKLTNLISLDLGDNPFDNPPQPVIVQGVSAILEYLKQQHDLKSDGAPKKKGPRGSSDNLAVKNNTKLEYQTMTRGY